MATRGKSFSMHCPFPIDDYPVVTLGHGGGGKLTAQLVEKIFCPIFNNTALSEQHDGAFLRIGQSLLAFTTDSYVVKPIFFPGGDIGKLSVVGSANDLAMCGARPLYLSCGFIIEEGLATESLIRIAQSMQQAADEIRVQLVTGDTKVVDKGKGDSLFINTAGVGLIEHNRVTGPKSIRAGDAVLISSDVGRHGVAILSKREGLNFEAPLESDCSHLTPMVMALLEEGVDLHCLRDLTRGGLATALVELAQSSGFDVEVEEAKVPVQEMVRGACEMLGLDPLYVANEGCFIAFVGETDAAKALSILKRFKHCSLAAQIGVARKASGKGGRVSLKSFLGIGRLLEKLSGEQLPRIC